MLALFTWIIQNSAFPVLIYFNSFFTEYVLHYIALRTIILLKKKIFQNFCLQQRNQSLHKQFCSALPTKCNFHMIIPTFVTCRARAAHSDQPHRWVNAKLILSVQSWNSFAHSVCDLNEMLRLPKIKWNHLCRLPFCRSVKLPSTRILKTQCFAQLCINQYMSIPFTWHIMNPEGTVSLLHSLWENSSLPLDLFKGRGSVPVHHK